MTNNLAKCMNSILKGARSLPIWALVKTIFQRTNLWLAAMIAGGHQFPEDIVVSLRKNQQQFVMSRDLIKTLQNLMFKKSPLSIFDVDLCPLKSN